MLYGLVEFCAVAGWLGVTVEQASKGAPVGKEMTGTTVDTSSNTTATRGLMIEMCSAPIQYNKYHKSLDIMEFWKE